MTQKLKPQFNLLYPDIGTLRAPVRTALEQAGYTSLQRFHRALNRWMEAQEWGADPEKSTAFEWPNILGTMIWGGISPVRPEADAYTWPAVAVAGFLKRLPAELFRKLPAHPPRPVTREEFGGVGFEDEGFDERVELTGLRVRGAEEDIHGPIHAGPEAEAAFKELQRDMSKALGTLSPSHERALRLRFGIGCEELTTQEMAETAGIEVKGVVDACAKGIRLLKHPSRGRALRQSLDTI